MIDTYDFKFACCVYRSFTAIDMRLPCVHIRTFVYAYSITLTKGILHHNVSDICIVYGEVGRCAVPYRCTDATVFIFWMLLKDLVPKYLKHQ